jgi:hypothetical protein
MLGLPEDEWFALAERLPDELTDRLDARAARLSP